MAPVTKASHNPTSVFCQPNQYPITAAISTSPNPMALPLVTAQIPPIIPTPTTTPTRGDSESPTDTRTKTTQVITMASLTNFVSQSITAIIVVTHKIPKSKIV